ncbi:putative UDP-galactose transporter [Scheffersomyces amazonensis]|uniref:putative UDP-galactose transporter n=1 Tax=Scheffersomyces amazonensis TaxID=1078765 RepID=UPI00315CCA50
MASSYLFLIVIGTLVTGAANSLFTKYQDNQCVRNCSNPDVSTHKNFEQPGIQTFQMFVGEFAMIFVYYLIYKSKYGIQSRNEGYTQIGGEQNSDEAQQEQSKSSKISVFENWKLVIPAACDLFCTTLLNIGLVYTPVSIYQMTRGSVVLFVAMLSVLFLNRKITKLEWVSLFFVSLGVALVGLSGSKNAESSSTTDGVSLSGLVILGISLIVVGELLQAFQFVIEEHILDKHPIVPLQIVYSEGFFGCAILLVGMIILSIIVGAIQSPEQFEESPFNLVEAVSQVVHSKQVFLSSICIMISIAIFNYCGITLTHELSATARSTIDTCRTLLVWILAILMGWEQFHLLQFFGFAVLVFGTLCFNGILTPENWPFIPQWLKEDTNPEGRLIDVVDEQIERM